MTEGYPCEPLVNPLSSFVSASGGGRIRRLLVVLVGPRCPLTSIGVLHLVGSNFAARLFLSHFWCDYLAELLPPDTC